MDKVFWKIVSIDLIWQCLAYPNWVTWKLHGHYSHERKHNPERKSSQDYLPGDACDSISILSPSWYFTMSLVIFYHMRVSRETSFKTWIEIWCPFPLWDQLIRNTSRNSGVAEPNPKHSLHNLIEVGPYCQWSGFMGLKFAWAHGKSVCRCGTHGSSRRVQTK